MDMEELEAEMQEMAIDGCRTIMGDSRQPMQIRVNALWLSEVLTGDRDPGDNKVDEGVLLGVGQPPH